LHQLDDEADAHLEELGGLPARRTVLDRKDNSLAQIVRIRTGHQWLASSPSQ
jgi:hypothetical protein